MIRRPGFIMLAVLLVLSACGDDDAGIPTTSEATSTSTSTSTTTTVVPTTTTLPPTTTTTSFDPRPPTAPDPEMVELSGLWRWPNTHTRYMQLLEHGVISVGDIVDDAIQLSFGGRWTLNDGLIEIRFLQIGGACDNEAVGYYEVSRSGNNLAMTLVEDECENRAVWLIGIDRTNRTWLPAQP